MITQPMPSSPPPPPTQAAGPTLPRLLTAVGSDRAPRPLHVHRRTYPAPPMPGRQPRLSFIEAVERAGLRGRGGAGFPTGRKLRSVSEGGKRPIVVVNGSEGEPASAKDVLLMSQAPHLVLDGALLAAAALGAREVIICIERDKASAVRSIEAAIVERVRAHEPMVATRVQDIPPRYVAGEETALVHHINGGEARPLLTPPRPYQRGVDGRPTLIDNVETLCHLAQIARWGPTWFRGQGTADEPGTMLLTLSGAIGRRGVCEIPIGMPMHRVIQAAEPTHEIGAVLVGGYYGTWLSAEHARWVTMDNAALRTIDSALGCGALIGLPAAACGVVETARVLNWLAGETAGQCGPCVHGLAAIAGGMKDLAVGTASTNTLRLLQHWGSQIEGRGACSFPDGAVRLMRSALKVFESDIARHISHGPCAAAYAPPTLQIPSGQPAKAKVWR
jgi:NADH:ubiquinone oxidoreductase subunit F (NADH-binding)